MANKLKDFFHRKIVKDEANIGETFLTWKETIGYGMGKGAQGMTTSIMNSSPANYFITNIFGISTGRAASIRFFCGLWDAINDPILGFILDRTRSKDGDKMRPYIKWAPFLSALFTLMFFVGQPGWSPAFKLVFMVIAFVGWDMAYTCVDVPIGALALSITPNAVERMKLFGIANIMRTVMGILTGGIITVALTMKSVKENPTPVYVAAAIVAFIGMIAFTRPTYLWTKERATYSEEVPSFKEQMGLLLQNKPLFMLVIANVIFLFTTLPSAVGMYFTIDLMGNSAYNLILGFAGGPAIFLSAIIVPKIAEKLGNKMDVRKFYIACCLGGAAIHILMHLTMKNYLTANAGAVGWGGAIAVMIFVGLAALPTEFKNICAKQMEAETVDYIERKTGQRAEGVMLSLIAFTGKLQNSASSAVVLFFLALAKYQEHADALPYPQTGGAYNMLINMNTLIPAVAWLLMIVPIWFFNTRSDKQKKA